MLIYHPAYDIYHTSFRIISILANSLSNCLEFERVRLYDFILLFPHDLQNVTLPAGSGGIKHKYDETQYNRLPNRRKVFNQVRNYFELSVHCLISYGALDLKSYQDGLLCKGPKFESISAQLEDSRDKLDAEILNYFKTVFAPIPIGDLKKRFHYN